MPINMRGKLYEILEAKQVSDRFRKQEFVIEVEDGRYTQVICFQVVNDKIEQLADFAIGDEVDVTFNIRGREWKSPSGEVKFFNTLDAWKIDAVGGQRQQSMRREDQRGGSGQIGTAPVDDGDIPF